MSRSDSAYGAQGPWLIDTLAPVPESYGWLRAAISAGRGLSKVLPKLIQSAEYNEKQAKLDLVRAEKRYERAKTPGAKSRAEKRLYRARERYECMRIKTAMTEKGIIDEGPVKEACRNWLFTEYDNPDTESGYKDYLYTRIAKYDVDLKRLKAKDDMLTKSGSGSMAQIPVNAFPKGDGPPFPPPRHAGDEVR